MKAINWCVLVMLLPLLALGADLETVTIQATKDKKALKREIGAYVSAITLPATGEALARWQVPVCPLIAGMSREKGEFMLARLSRIVRDAGAPLGPEDCSPNFLVVTTAAPAELLKKWWRSSPGLFDESRGKGGIRRFIEEDRPVRVWYNSDQACVGAQMALGLPGGGGATMCRSGGMASRLVFGAVKTIASVIIVIDSTSIHGLTLGQMTDYVGMVGLAQIRRNPDLGSTPTILSLFAEPGESTADAPRVPALSPWDSAFLESLYHTDSRKVTQKAEIDVDIYRALTTAQPQD
jgi:hypothetical protein